MGSIDIPIEFINGCEWHRIYWQWEEEKYALDGTGHLAAYRCGLGTPGQPAVLGQKTKARIIRVTPPRMISGVLLPGKLTISPEVPASPMSEERVSRDEGTPMNVIKDTPQSPSNVASSMSDSSYEDTSLRVTSPVPPVREQKEEGGSSTVTNHGDKGKGRARETSGDEERQRASLLDEYHRIQETRSHYEHQVTNEGSSQVEDQVMTDLCSRQQEIYDFLIHDEEMVEQTN